MTDALLVADQHIDEGFFAPRSRQGGGLTSWPLTLAPYAFEEPRQFAELQIFGGQTLAGHRAHIDAYLRRAEKAFEHLAKSQEHAVRAQQFREETRWLAENRKRFAGQWIALQGRQLLAVGATAREVFLKVASETTPPLVILVDSDEPPFAGW